MDTTLVRIGNVVLGTVDPGAPFVLVSGAAVLTLAALRLAAGRTGSGLAWLGAWRRIEHGAITLLLVAMVVLSLVQVILRNLFETGFVWLDPLLRHGVLWLGFLGAMLATSQDRHISIDALSRTLSGIPARAVHALLRLFAAAVALLLANACYLLVRDEHAFGSTSFLEIPTWALMVIMPFGLTVMSYRFVLSAWRGRAPDPVPATDEHERLDTPDVAR